MIRGHCTHFLNLIFLNKHSQWLTTITTEQSFDWLVRTIFILGSVVSERQIVTDESRDIKAGSQSLFSNLFSTFDRRHLKVILMLGFVTDKK